MHKFGRRLYLCYKDATHCGVSYQHWFVTDKTWTIEFGGGNVTNATVLVHNNPKGSYIIEDEFANTTEVKKRMKMVCGTTNYSLALRNCEHVARYIFCGRWICMQMLGDGALRKVFFDHSLGTSILLIVIVHLLAFSLLRH